MIDLQSLNLINVPNDSTLDHYVVLINIKLFLIRLIWFMITDLISIVEYFKNYSNQCSFLRMTLTYLKMRAKADTLALNY